MQTKKIAIIGNGILGSSTCFGFIQYHPEYNAHNALLLGRSYFDKDPREDCISEQSVPLKNFDIIILAVKPTDAIKTLLLLRGKISPGTIVISLISGLSMHLICMVLGIPHHRVVTATTTTNVICGEGILVFNTPTHMVSTIVKDLFRPLTKLMIEVPGNKVLKGVVWEGAVNAVYFKYILLKAHKVTNVPFATFIENLTMEDAGIQSFIQRQDEACKLFFGRDCFVYQSFEASLNTIKKTCSSTQDIEGLIERVATPKGCTAEGVGELNDLEKISVELLFMILNKIYRKALTFGKIINADFKKLNLPVPESKRRIKSYIKTWM